MYSYKEQMRNLAKTMILVSAALAFMSCGTAEDRNVLSEEERIVKVGVVRVTEIDTDAAQTYVGKIEPSKKTLIYSQASGTITELNVRKGDQVRKGDVMAVIKSEQVRSMYEIAESTLTLAEDGYERARKVYDCGGISEQKFEEIKSDLAKAQASERAAKDAMDNCRIKAPYDGIVNEVYAEQGTDISMGTALVQILNTHEVEITFSVPETEISHISYGQQALVKVPALGKTVEGVVSVTGHTASAMSHSYECRLAPEKADGLLPGMSCKVSLIMEGQPSLTVPVHAVMTDASGRYLWMVTDGTVEKRYVAVVGYNADGVVISDGLADGDMIIVDGRRKVSSGMKVKTVER